MKKTDILITDAFTESILKQYEKKYNIVYSPRITPEELIEVVCNYDILIISTRLPVQKELLAKASRLKLIVRMGAGVDQIDLGYCAKKNIVVCNTPGSNVSPVVEYVFGELLRLMRDFESMDRSVMNGEFRKGIKPGGELFSKSIGIIGAGRIGSRIAGTAKQFGMTVFANDPYLTEKQKKKIAVDRWLSRPELLKRSDIVTLHVPLTRRTAHLADMKFFSGMKNGSILINASRGRVLKLDDAVKFAKQGIIKKFIIDVFENEPCRPEIPDNVRQYFFFSPHAGAYTEESFLNRSIEALEEVDEFLSGRKPHGFIDPKKGY